MLLLVGWLIIVLLVKISRVISGSRTASKVDITESKSSVHSPPPPPVWKEVVVLSGVVLTYVFSVFLSWIFEYMDLPLNLIVFTMIYSFLFMMVSGIGGSLLLRLLIPVRNV